MHPLWRVREGLSDGCDYDVLGQTEREGGKKKNSDEQTVTAGKSWTTVKNFCSRKVYRKGAMRWWKGEYKNEEVCR